MDLRSQRMEDEWAIVCQMADANPECIRAKERLGDEFLLVMERTTAPVCRDQEIVLVQEHNKQLEKLVKQQRDLRMQQAQLAQQQDEQHQKFLFAKEAGVFDTLQNLQQSYNFFHNMKDPNYGVIRDQMNRLDALGYL